MINFRTPKLTKLIAIVYKNMNKNFRMDSQTTLDYQKTPPTAAHIRGLGVATPSAVTETDQE